MATTGSRCARQTRLPILSARPGLRFPVPGSRFSRCICRKPPPDSALHAHDLLEGVQGLGRTALVCHHLVDVLVRAWNLIEHAFVLAAEDAGGLSLQVGFGEVLLGIGSAHAAAGTVGAEAEALGMALATDDVARAHAARHDAQVAFAGADGAFAGHPGG